MSQVIAPAPIIYPESDGKPMADNTKQFRWITILASNIAGMFRHRNDVFVGGDMLWYPVEGENEIRQAPDVYVVFGRPKGDRGSYRQWEENDIPITVVFEILSPSNTIMEMVQKFSFYDEYGVEEYYIYNPDANKLDVYQRGKETLHYVRNVEQYTSPRLGIRFDLSTQPEMTVYRSDGRRFLTFEELEESHEQQQERADKQQQRADKAEQRADKAEQRAARLAELGRKARRGQASEAELQELDHLEQQ